jgi:hypothetical protein
VYLSATDLIAERVTEVVLAEIKNEVHAVLVAPEDADGYNFDPAHTKKFLNKLFSSAETLAEFIGDNVTEALDEALEDDETETPTDAEPVFDPLV